MAREANGGSRKATGKRREDDDSSTVVDACITGRIPGARVCLAPVLLGADAGRVAL
jgi:hypothetical protein